jgi:hypothetical protein
LEREGPTNDGSGENALQSTNVVRLPRDWLGPLDQLVPFGPGAATRPDSPASADGGSMPTGEVTPDPFAAPSAQSFWTADAASLHAPLRGPPPAVDDSAGSTIEEHRPRDAAGLAASRSRGTRRWAAPAAVLVGVAVVVVAIIGYGQHATRHVIGIRESSAARATAHTNILAMTGQIAPELEALAHQVAITADRARRSSATRRSRARPKATRRRGHEAITRSRTSIDSASAAAPPVPSAATPTDTPQTTPGTGGSSATPDGSAARSSPPAGPTGSDLLGGLGTCVKGC